MILDMAKKPKFEAASAMGKRSAAARKKKWGAAEFTTRMQEWGKLGGRPKGSGTKQTRKGGE
jgi:hypothetical protein